MLNHLLNLKKLNYLFFIKTIYKNYFEKNNGLVLYAITLWYNILFHIDDDNIVVKICICIFLGFTSL